MDADTLDSHVHRLERMPYHQRGPVGACRPQLPLTDTEKIAAHEMFVTHKWQAGGQATPRTDIEFFVQLPLWRPPKTVPNEPCPAVSRSAIYAPECSRRYFVEESAPILERSPPEVRCTGILIKPRLLERLKQLVPFSQMEFRFIFCQ